MTYSATIDVPDLDQGLAFYGSVFGYAEVARPIPIYAVLSRDGQSLGLMQKPSGSQPTPAKDTRRGYDRHWTPVHLDFEVTDFDPALTRITAGGGQIEQRHDVPGRRRIAFCADPFGHGFCVLGPAATD